MDHEKYTRMINVPVLIGKVRIRGVAMEGFEISLSLLFGIGFIWIHWIHLAIS